METVIDHGMKKGDLCAKTGLSSSNNSKDEQTASQGETIIVWKKSAKSWIVTLEI